MAFQLSRHERKPRIAVLNKSNQNQPLNFDQVTYEEETKLGSYDSYPYLMFGGLDSEGVPDLSLAGNLEPWDATGFDTDLKFQ